MRKFNLASLMVAATILAGCMTDTNPDYRIVVAPNPVGQGYIAVPPECPSADEAFEANIFDNQPIPNYGCAHARNLALMVEDPLDLVEGSDPGSVRAERLTGAIDRYNNDKIRGLWGDKLPPAVE